jgi:uncharacterized GH25 family protein
MPACRKTTEAPVGERHNAVPIRRRERLPARRWWIGATLLLLSATVSAHDTWLLPSRARVPAGGTVVLDLTSGMRFPKNDVPVKPERLEKASLLLRGKEVAISERSLEKNALRLRVRPAEAGIATLSVESKPRTLELSAKEVREYLEEIGAWETAGKQWSAGGSGRWRETYVKHAKTFVRVGEPKADDSWREAVGMTLELVPEKDPTQLKPGDELSVRVLRDGRPLPGLSVGLASAGDAKGILRTSDSDGRVTFPLPRPGWWLLRATQLTKSSKPDADWESHFATLTVFVAGQGRE